MSNVIDAVNGGAVNYRRKAVGPSKIESGKAGRLRHVKEHKLDPWLVLFSLYLLFLKQKGAAVHDVGVNPTHYHAHHSYLKHFLFHIYTIERATGQRFLPRQWSVLKLKGTKYLHWDLETHIRIRARLGLCHKRR